MSIEQISNFFDYELMYLLRHLLIILIVSWAVARYGTKFALWVISSQPFINRYRISVGRLEILKSLVSGMVHAVTYIVGFVLILLTLQVPSGAILTTLGLFSAAFGLGARPLISDYLAGIVLIFEDQFSVGDKVELLEIVGHVEAVDLRLTQIRAETGEVYLIPNGDVRVIRNLSRGKFSVATIKITVATEDLARALKILEDVADRAQDNLPDLVGRPTYLSEDGVISQNVTLTLAAKAVYGRGAKTRPQLMALVTEAFKAANLKINV